MHVIIKQLFPSSFAYKKDKWNALLSFFFPLVGVVQVFRVVHENVIHNAPIMANDRPNSPAPPAEMYVNFQGQAARPHL